MFKSRACSPVDGATKGNHPTHHAQGQQDARARTYLGTHHNYTCKKVVYVGVTLTGYIYYLHPICSQPCLFEHPDCVKGWAGEVVMQQACRQLNFCYGMGWHSMLPVQRTYASR
jgi:hypothetical protein